MNDSQERRHYEFAPGVVVRLVAPRGRVLTHFDQEYSAAATGAIESPQIEVFGGDFNRVVSEAQAHYPDVLLRRSRHKTIVWKTALWGMEDDTTRVAFTGHGPLVTSFLQTFYVEPLLRPKLLEAGLALVHGCALVGRDGSSVLFVGTSGVGKTTMALQHLLEGERIQGDNYVILGRNGQTRAFRRRLRLYSDLPQTYPEVFRSLSKREQLRMRLQGALRKASFGYVNLPNRLAIGEIFSEGQVCPTAKLRAVFHLSLHDSPDLVQTSLPRDQMIERIVSISISEATWLRELTDPYLKSRPESRMNGLEEMEEAILHRELDGVETGEILVPRGLDIPDLARQIRSLCGVANTAE